jgi:hypothetical protein
MCIINSINQDANSMKIPNIVVNACSVLIMSLSNSIKSSEKFELFKKLSQQFMIISQELEQLESEDEEYKNKLNILSLKYDNLIQDCAFEDIPNKYKMEVAKCFYNAEKHIPIQLNGNIGNFKKRNSKEIILSANTGNVFINELV